MRSIRARFNKFDTEPVSTFIAFSRAVKGQKFSRDSIVRNFVRLVDSDDYSKEDKNTLISHLFHLSNPSEEHKIDAKTAPKCNKTALTI